MLPKRLRALASQPGMLLTAVATIGLGVGLNATIFTVMSPSASGGHADLLSVRRFDPHGNRVSLSGADANELSQHSEWFVDAFAQARWETRTGKNGIRGMVVSSNYFSAFGVPAALDSGLLLSRRASLAFFAWPTPPPGSLLDLNGCQVRISGTVPEWFTGAERAPSDFWMSEQASKACGSAGAPTALYQVIAKLRPGAKRPASLPAGDGGSFTFAEAAEPFVLSNNRREAVSPLLLAFFLSLTIPCLNVANLMLARSLSRHREIGIRLALGASRFQIVRLLVEDGILIGLLGALVGFCVAWVGVRVVDVLIFLGATLPAAAGLRSNFPIPRVDPAVFLSCLVSGVAAALLFSVGPALRASAQPVCESLRGEVAGWRISRLLRGSVVVQVSFCAFVLAVSAALLWNIHELGKVDPGFAARGVITVDGASEPDAARRALEREGWVESAAFSSGVRNFSVDSAGHDALTTLISSGYFRTLGIPLRAGRDFTPEEVSDGAGSVIVSAATAEALWPGQSPVGRAISLDSFDLRNAGLPANGKQQTVRVVGVAADVITGSLWKGIDRYRLYLPGRLLESPPQLLIRVAGGDAGTGLSRVTRFFARDNQDRAVFAMPFDEKIASDRFLAGIIAGISTALAALMLILALSGMYSMFALTTELRMREFAIRSAVGASPRSLFRKVTGSAVFLSCSGAAVGVLVFAILDALVLGDLEFRLLGSRMIVYFGVPLVMISMGLVSSFAPGLRAGRTEVAALLREAAE
jgi:ABC-type antimicrobial peptide transport system permease subunit